MERYYQPEIECASREQILAWQNERLLKQVRNVWDNVPYYRKKMEAKGVTPEDIKSVDDLHKLPFVTKDDLRESYPYGLVARPLRDCVRIQSTSGTTGKRVVAFRSRINMICRSVLPEEVGIVRQPTLWLPPFKPGPPVNRP